MEAPGIVVDAVNDARIAGSDHTWRLDLPGEPAMVSGDTPSRTGSPSPPTTALDGTGPRRKWVHVTGRDMTRQRCPQ